LVNDLANGLRPAIEEGKMGLIFLKLDTDVTATFVSSVTPARASGRVSLFFFFFVNSLATLKSDYPEMRVVMLEYSLLIHINLEALATALENPSEVIYSVPGRTNNRMSAN